MIHTYARAILVLAAAVLATILAPAPAVAGDTVDCSDVDYEITIDVAPTIINLQHFGMWLTIHTDIAHGNVKKAEVYFNMDEETTEEDAFSCWDKTDDLGYYVAKCDIREFSQIGGKIGGSTTITLKGEDTGEQEFCGFQTVKVIDQGPESSPPRKGVK